MKVHCWEVFEEYLYNSSFNLKKESSYETQSRLNCQFSGLYFPKSIILIIIYMYLHKTENCTLRKQVLKSLFRTKTNLKDGHNIIIISFSLYKLLFFSIMHIFNFLFKFYSDFDDKYVNSLSNINLNNMKWKLSYLL